ncbi:iron-sulfur cluster carrier protein ApbC [Legionella dresdenensis]|uniref:Iron-sulfur cluster carrier protein n=1 Tax=Legionella dresdenensis TaxID=450200 RepID=A0ABV8CHZ4_9GAMM
MSEQVAIVEKLTQLRDPFLNLTAEQMNLKAGLEATGNGYHLQLQAGFPIETLDATYLPLLKEALGSKVQVTLESRIRPRKTQLAGHGLRGVKNTIAIASGKGGVGKSTVTVNLAVALAKAGARVGILDADIYGPSIPLMLGKHEPVQLQDDNYLPVKVHGLEAMSIGYLTDSEQALIWRGPMLAKSLLQMLDITLWNDLDYLFIDLPPGTGDIQLSLVQKIPLTAAVIVTTPQNVATLDAQKAIKMFEKTNIDVAGVVENMSTHICSHCGHQEPIFGEGGGVQLSANFNVPLLGQLPLDSIIRHQADLGTPSASGNDPRAQQFSKIALRLAAAIAAKPLNYAEKFPPIKVE